MPWAEQLKLIINEFQDQRQLQKEHSCLIAVQLIEDLCGYQLQQKALNEKQAKQLQPILTQQYYHWMRKREKQAHDELQVLFKHQHLKREQSALQLSDDLFDTKKWFAWGLNKSQLTKVSALAGASAGGAIDLALAGQSFLLGAVTGGILGSATAWLSGDKLSKVKIKGLSLGGYEATQGPIANKNFPYVVLARFLYVYRSIQGRNHALRDNLEIEDHQVSKLLEQLQSKQRQQLYKALDKLSRQKPPANLVEILMPLFELDAHKEVVDA